MFHRSARVISRVLRLEPHKNFKGKDLYGNHYYEVPPQKYFLGLLTNSKLKRVIEPPNPEKYIRGGLEVGKNVPSEWQSWLQMRRDDPPTFEEVENNLLKMETVAEKARKLESAREAETRKNLEKPKPPEKKAKEEQEVESWTP